MKIESLRIQNLRAFEDVTVPFNDYTCLVGHNGSGKSAVFCALNIFFRDNSHSPVDLLSLQEEDFHNRNTDHPIIITVTFINLNAEAQEAFKDYYRNGKLVVTAYATFDHDTKKAEVKQYGSRLGIKEFSTFFEAETAGKSVQDLKSLYNEIRNSYQGLPPPGTKAQMADALHEFEELNSQLCKLIPSRDEFYGFTKGANRMAPFIQWVCIPAVKDVTSEQVEGKNTALGKLLARTVRARTNFDDILKSLRSKAEKDYQKLLEENQSQLDAISLALKKRLVEWAHPNAGLRLQWRHDSERSIRVEEPLAEIIASEGIFEGHLARFGHGLQRSYILALLHELAASEDPKGPTLILGCEEPELYQHPPQVRYLAHVLQKLSKQNCQVVVCTHSPNFVSGEAFKDVRLFRMNHKTSDSSVRMVTVEGLATQIQEARGEAFQVTASGATAKIHQELQPGINEMFFTPFIIIVEGIEDYAYISTYLTLLGLDEKYRELGCHIVCAGGKSHIIQPLAVAVSLGIPVFVIFDSDGHQPDKNGRRVMHEKDNKTILNLRGLSSIQPFSSDNVWADGLVMWKSELGKVIGEDFGAHPYARIRDRVRKGYGVVRNLDKNMLFISDVLMATWNEGMKSQNLERVCREIIRFAQLAVLDGNAVPVNAQRLFPEEP